MHLLNLLNGRPHLGLEDIESVALMDRYDSKFLVPEHWLSHTLTQLKDHAVLAIADALLREGAAHVTLLIPLPASGALAADEAAMTLMQLNTRRQISCTIHFYQYMAHHQIVCH